MKESCSHRATGALADERIEHLFCCPVCGLVYSKHCLDEADPALLYNNYYCKNETAGRFNPWIEFIIKALRFFRALKIFTIAPRAKRILDVGSGRGFMLYFLKKYYHYTRTAGTQISRRAYEFSKEVLGLEIYNEDLLKIPFREKEFDIVSMWHVLEHVKEPELYIKRIHEILADKGKVIIEVPNFNAWTKWITGRHWMSLDREFHLYFFTPEILSALLRRHGFKIKIVHTFSLEYSTFTSVQSLVNWITRSDNLFFRFLTGAGGGSWLVPHILLFMLLTPVCFVINFILYFSRFGEILLVTGEK